ncbi:MAG: ChrR family anti-sigma-E factor [Cohaesibacter sp.]|nr:ChrR family anti-sigma-E factor [Cohaesibacter sp.]
MINHHLSDEMILAYAAGSLPAGQAMLVRCHLDMCPHCLQRLMDAQNVGGALLDALPEMDLNEGGFDRLLAQIDDMPALDEASSHRDHTGVVEEEALSASSSHEPDMPALLHDVMGHGFDDIKWKLVGPGIRQFILPVQGSEGEKVRLLKLSPGFVTPQHSHHGSEITLVLKGSFCDETGRYKKGDIQEADDDIDHQPIADTEEDCICLTVTDAPLEFKKMMPRLFQPIVGI